MLDLNAGRRTEVKQGEALLGTEVKQGEALLGTPAHTSVAYSENHSGDQARAVRRAWVMFHDTRGLAYQNEVWIKPVARGIKSLYFDTKKGAVARRKSLDASILRAEERNARLKSARADRSKFCVSSATTPPSPTLHCFPMPPLPLSSQLTLRLFPPLLYRVVVIRAVEPSLPASRVEHIVHAAAIMLLRERREE